MKTLVTALLRSYTNIACQIGWLSAWLGLKHVSGNRWLSRALQWRDCRIRAAPDKNTAMQNVEQVVRQPNSPPANPASSTQPTQPSHPTPSKQHPASKPPKHDKLLQIVWFSSRARNHRKIETFLQSEWNTAKTHEFVKLSWRMCDIVLKCHCFCVISYKMRVPANNT